MRVFPYGALQFTSFELFKTLLPCLGLGWLGKEAHTMKFVAGSLAGLTAVSATFPLDTIRARLAFQVVGETKYQGIFHAGGSIMRTEGAVGLYRGLTPTLLGIIPYAGPGWQKLHGSTGGTRRKVWTRTKILSPNIRYFVAN